MTHDESIAFLDDLIEKTKKMSKEEWAAREKELGVDKIRYNPYEYLGTFHEKVIYFLKDMLNRFSWWIRS